MSSCKSKEQKITPIVEDITESVYASGIIKSKNQYQVFSAVSGLTDRVFVTEGDLVKNGDPIIHLTNTTAFLNEQNATISANYASVSANAERLSELKNEVSLAKIKMDNDASLLQRQKNLWDQQIGTHNSLDERELAYKNSANAWETARLKYAELEKQINFQARQSQKNLELSQNASDDYTVKSKANGKVYDILVEKGEMVNTQSAIALVGDANYFLLELQVDEYDIGRIKGGQKVILSMDSYKGEVFEAVVDRILPLMNERSKSFTIEASFVKQPAALYPNLTCEANIIIQVKRKALTIPRVCLQEGDYVMLESHEKRKVVTGLKDYQKVEILSGLNVTDVIIKPLQ